VPPLFVHHYRKRGWKVRAAVPLDVHGHLLCRPAQPAPARLALLIAEDSRGPASLAPEGVAA
jgi:hypothetical protein